MTHKRESSREALELGILYKISHALAHRHDLVRLFEETLDILESEMGLSRGTLALRRPDSDVFVIEAARHLSPVARRRGEYRPGEGVTGRVAKTGKAMLVEDIARDPLFLDRTKSRRRNDSAAFLCVPIIRQRCVIGTLSMDRPRADRPTLDRDLNFLKLVADLLGEAVEAIREEIEERESLAEENRRLQRQIGEKHRPENIIGNCNAMQRVYEQIARVADSSATVLIRGESGTGKELVARAVHFGSPFRDHPFVSVNCAALPETLVESELFGHEKGAFTGAVHQRQGCFERADGGTLFLDEIGDVSPKVQIRLLRVLQEQSFERVGGAAVVKVNARIVAATSRNLEGDILEGRFRDDLYYRLNVFPIHLPPLRERRSDIMLLADYFVRKFNRAYRKQVKRISTAAINMMTQYHWPGNVRELENCIERAVLTSADGVIHGYALPPSLQTDAHTGTALLPEEGASLTALVGSYEKEVIIDALKVSRGNVAAAARRLRATPRIVRYKIRQLDIRPDDYRS